MIIHNKSLTDSVMVLLSSSKDPEQKSLFQSEDNQVHFKKIRLTMQPVCDRTGLTSDSATELSGCDKAGVRSVLQFNKKRRHSPTLP